MRRGDFGRTGASTACTLPFAEFTLKKKSCANFLAARSGGLRGRPNPPRPTVQGPRSHPIAGLGDCRADGDKGRVMDELSRRSPDPRTRVRQVRPERRHKTPNALDGGAEYRPGATEPAQRPVARVVLNERPWVGVRFLRALIIAVPLALGLWVGIVWAISKLF